jgi:hypothetical protein
LDDDDDDKAELEIKSYLVPFFPIGMR